MVKQCEQRLVACGDPGAPAHGVRTPDETSSFLDGAKVHFRCDTGYHLNGSSSITCLTNGNWDSELPECQAVACQGEPPSVNGTNVTVTGNEFKALAIYECSDGLIPTASPVSYCQTDGTWSQSDFSCTVPTSSPTETSPTSVKTTGWGTSQSLSTTDMTTQPQTTNFQTTAYSLHSTKPVMSSSPTPDGVSSTKMSVTGYPLTESATTLRGTTRGEITHTSSGTVIAGTSAA
ncbi:E-selectin-like [Diadema antillarum]|uniref:E-selectin-like n=1 Tax=Diadema antillarum TaxID=105358 RepID=UPI003A87CFD6